MQKSKWATEEPLPQGDKPSGPRHYQPTKHVSAAEIAAAGAQAAADTQQQPNKDAPKAPQRRQGGNGRSKNKGKGKQDDPKPKNDNNNGQKKQQQNGKDANTAPPPNVGPASSVQEGQKTPHAAVTYHIPPQLGLPYTVYCGLLATHQGRLISPSEWESLVAAEKEIITSGNGLTVPRATSYPAVSSPGPLESVGVAMSPFGKLPTFGSSFRKFQPASPPEGVMPAEAALPAEPNREQVVAAPASEAPLALRPGPGAKFVWVDEVDELEARDAAESKKR
jgi:hypothetical protein